jgi:hypothetical protein
VKRTLGIVLASSLLVGIGAVAQASPKPSHAYDAILICPRLAEDSAAHVRLVKYSDEGEGLMIVYRCKREGY